MKIAAFGGCFNRLVQRIRGRFECVFSISNKKNVSITLVQIISESFNDFYTVLLVFYHRQAWGLVSAELRMCCQHNQHSQHMVSSCIHRMLSLSIYINLTQFVRSLCMCTRACVCVCAFVRKSWRFTQTQPNASYMSLMLILRLKSINSCYCCWLFVRLLLLLRRVFFSVSSPKRKVNKLLGEILSMRYQVFFVSETAHKIISMTTSRIFIEKQLIWTRPIGFIEEKKTAFLECKCEKKIVRRPHHKQSINW